MPSCLFGSISILFNWGCNSHRHPGNLDVPYAMEGRPGDAEGRGQIQIGTDIECFMVAISVVFPVLVCLLCLVSYYPLAYTGQLRQRGAPVHRALCPSTVGAMGGGGKRHIEELAVAGSPPPFKVTSYYAWQMTPRREPAPPSGLTAHIYDTPTGRI